MCNVTKGYERKKEPKCVKMKMKKVKSRRINKE